MRKKPGDSGHLDTDLLDEDELSRYEELRRAPFSPGNALLFGLAVLTPIAVFVWAAVMESRTRGSADNSDVIFDLLTVAVLVLGWMPGLAAWKSASAKAKKDRDERLYAFRKEIGYDRRARYRSGRGSGGVSRRAMQHAWYGNNNQDLNWTHRAEAETYGMDVDSYRNNVLERD